MLDFYSDCRTIPSRTMRETVLDANVGDEQRGEDPTTLSLCRRVAQIVGKEEAIFMPSGTMCNEVALYIFCQRGEVVICERTSHIINFEVGAPAALAGAQIQAMDGERGMLTTSHLDQAMKQTGKGGNHLPHAAALVLEQTTNLGGGAVWPLEQLTSVATHAKSFGLKTYLDGARLFNACVRSGITADRYCASFDAVSLDFTKGLGCPFGAVLAGPRDFIAKAWRVRQMFGGGMRQSGIMTAMAHYALDHNVDRLAEDHSVAAHIGAALSTCPKIACVLPVETNIVIFEISTEGPTAQELVDFARKRGFKIGAFGRRTVRVVTHLDVDMTAARQLVTVIKEGLNA